MSEAVDRSKDTIGEILEQRVARPERGRNRSIAAILAVRRTASMK
jgi:hypothetical protein